MTSLLCLEGDAGLTVTSPGFILKPCCSRGTQHMCARTPSPHPPTLTPHSPLPVHFQGENMQSATIVQTKTAEENRANEGIKMHPWRHVFLYLSLWPSSSRLPNRSCLSLHFSSNCISWPDAGPSDDNMDAHLPLFRIRGIKTLNVEILLSYSNSLAPWQAFWQNTGLNQDIKCDTEMMIEKISTLLKPGQQKF